MAKEPTQAQREHMHNSALEEVYSAVYDAGLLEAVLTDSKFLEEMVEALKELAAIFGSSLEEARQTMEDALWDTPFIDNKGLPAWLAAKNVLDKLAKNADSPEEMRIC